MYIILMQTLKVEWVILRLCKLVQSTPDPDKQGSKKHAVRHGVTFYKCLLRTVSFRNATKITVTVSNIITVRPGSKVSITMSPSVCRSLLL